MEEEYQQMPRRTICIGKCAYTLWVLEFRRNITPTHKSWNLANCRGCQLGYVLSFRWGTRQVATNGRGLLWWDHDPWKLWGNNVAAIVRGLFYKTKTHASYRGRLVLRSVILVMDRRSQGQYPRHQANHFRAFHLRSITQHKNWRQNAARRIMNSGIIRNWGWSIYIRPSTWNLLVDEFHTQRNIHTQKSALCLRQREERHNSDYVRSAQTREFPKSLIVDP